MNILIHVPFHFNARDFFFTPVINKLKKNKNHEFFFLSPNKNLESYINSLEVSNIHIIYYSRQFKFNYESILFHLLYLLDYFYLMDSLKIRFMNLYLIKNLKIFQRKDRNGKRSQRRNLFDWKAKSWVSMPFPGSVRIFEALKFARSNLMYQALASDMRIIEENKIEKIILTRPDIPISNYWSRVAQNSHIPCYAHISSWDHPTTKGPISEKYDRYIVQSLQMQSELMLYHNIPLDKIFITGRPHHDLFYKKPKHRTKYNSSKYRIVITLNTEGLNEHEFDLIAAVQNWVLNNQLESKVEITVRFHPLSDNQKYSDRIKANNFTKFLRSKSTDSMELKASSVQAIIRDQKEYFTLLAAADVVIQSRSSVALDAIAAGTKVLHVAFDPRYKSKLHKNSFYFENYYEHYFFLTLLNIDNVITSFHELKSWLSQDFSHKKNKINISGVLSEYYLTYTDSFSSQRFIDSIIK